MPHLPVEFMNFSAGESHVKINPSNATYFGNGIVDYGFGPVLYIPKPTTVSLNDYIISIFLLRDIFQDPSLSLFLPYLPYSRQDRETHKGAPFSLRVLSDLLATAKFRNIYTLDVHSENAMCLIRNLVNIPIDDIFKTTLAVRNLGLKKTLVAPDVGAAKRLEGIEKYFDGVIYVIKHRNPVTGYLTIKEVIGDSKGKDLLIVDDICDGGRTFVEIANRVQDSSSISLYTTHGIYSKGPIELIRSGITNFYTTDSFPQNIASERWIDTKGKAVFNCLEILKDALT